MKQTKNEKVLGLKNPQDAPAETHADWSKALSDEHKEAIAETFENMYVDEDGNAIGPDIRTIMETPGLTASQLVPTMWKALEEGQIYAPKQKWVLINELGVETKRLASAVHKYYEQDSSSGTRKILDDNVFDEDGNGEFVLELEEISLIDDPYHKKIKIPGLVITDAWQAAADISEFVRVQFEANEYARMRRLELKAWELLDGQAAKLSVEATDDAAGTEIVAKALASQAEEYATTSSKHFGIGTNGTFKVKTINGEVELSNEYVADTSELTLIVDKDQFINEQWDLDAKLFNYGKTRQDFRKVIVLSLSKYSGLEAILNQEDGTVLKPAVTPEAGTKFYLFDHTALKVYTQYTALRSIVGISDFTMQHAFANLGTYRVKNKPVMKLVATAPAEATK